EERLLEAEAEDERRIAVAIAAPGVPPCLARGEHGPRELAIAQRGAIDHREIELARIDRYLARDVRRERRGVERRDPPDPARARVARRHLAQRGDRRWAPWGDHDHRDVRRRPIADRAVLDDDRVAIVRSNEREEPGAIGHARLAEALACELDARHGMRRR